MDILNEKFIANLRLINSSVDKKNVITFIEKNHDYEEIEINKMVKKILQIDEWKFYVSNEFMVDKNNSAANFVLSSLLIEDIIIISANVSLDSIEKEIMSLIGGKIDFLYKTWISLSCTERQVITDFLFKNTWFMRLYIQEFNHKYKVEKNMSIINGLRKLSGNFDPLKEVETVAIYGAGEIGKYLERILRKERIVVKCFIDLNLAGDRINGIPIITPDSLDDIKSEIDAIIITPIFDFEKIKLNFKKYHKKIISIEDIL